MASTRVGMASLKLTSAILVAILATIVCDGKQPDPRQLKPLKAAVNRYITMEIPKVGRLRGRVAHTQWSRKTLYQFVDIKYGKSPSGERRFKPSLPASPWRDVRNAFTPRRGCPSLQDMSYMKSAEKKNKDVEDCLFLSVHTKSFEGKSPVMVYVHGDFLYEGSSSEASPGYLLEEDVVLVSIRYRLGPFGFLSSMTEDIPGNAAVTDVILALKWIQSHIERFGGDPSRVTLFGQVGGAAMINVLTMSPAVPAGLFHRVIYQSGSALSPAFITDDPLGATKDMAKYSGCKNVQNIDSINKCLRNVTASKLLDAFGIHGNAHANQGIGSYGGIQFVIGGPSGILPDHPGKLLASENFKNYPTIGGSVKNAGTFILKDIFVDNFNETVPDDIYNGTGYINHIIAQTNGADPTKAWRKFAEAEFFTSDDIKNGSFYRMIPGLIDMCGTISFKNPVLLAMQANAKNLANSTYLYSFDYVGETNRYDIQDDEEPEVMPFDLGVSLTDDNLYLFPWPWYAMISNNRDRKVAKRMVALWTSFATTGIPKAPGVIDWPPMTDETGPYLKIGRTVSVGENFLDEYSITVKEAKMSYSLVNEEFFDDLEVIDPADDNKDVQESQEVTDEIVDAVEEQEENVEDEEESERPPKGEQNGNKNNKKSESETEAE